MVGFAVHASFGTLEGWSMFAIIETGGKQYRVEPGDVLEVELLGEGADGDAVRFDRVLMTSGDEGTALGGPLVDGAVVTASRIGIASGPKIRVFKTKRRNTQRRTKGHRQHYQRVKIEEIQLPSKSSRRKS
jgi:large subunit ribosomal protein L21